MIHVSQPMTTVPEHFSTPLQELVYRTLTRLSIPFQRVENDPAITMEDCQAIDDRLQMQTVKTLFLCNRQQTAFYLFVTPGDKPFRTKDFSAALGVSRVSFATPEQLERLMGTVVGSATVFSALLASAPGGARGLRPGAGGQRMVRLHRRHHHRLHEAAHPGCDRPAAPLHRPYAGMGGGVNARHFSPTSSHSNAIFT